jgi:hypothetical protein
MGLGEVVRRGWLRVMGLEAGSKDEGARKTAVTPVGWGSILRPWVSVA